MLSKGQGVGPEAQGPKYIENRSGVNGAGPVNRSWQVMLELTDDGSNTDLKIGDVSNAESVLGWARGMWPRVGCSVCGLVMTSRSCGVV